MSKDVHVLPQFAGEPEHDENVLCWCKPKIERGSGLSLVVVHRCLTRPEENTVTDRVEIS